MHKLNYFTKQDPRIKKVFDFAKIKYDKANVAQHNWEHIMRVLYRSLVIAETQKEVDYFILIPAAVLHDIGVAEESHDNHEETGVLVVKRDLPKFKYTEEEIEKIAHCVNAHGSVHQPQTLEAKILNDADKLEKSSYSSVFCFFRVQMEKKIPLDRWIDKGIEMVKRNLNHKFYTKKAQEICGDGFKERLDYFNKAKKV